MQNRDRDPPSYGFNITFDEQYDMNDEKLCNIADPLYENDAKSMKILRSYIQKEIDDLIKQIIDQRT